MFKGSVSTPIGKIDYLWENETLFEVFSGECTREVRTRNWPTLDKLLKDYFSGVQTMFNSIAVDESYLTPFQKKVLQEVRKIPYGETLTYKDISQSVGSPRAYQAVGSAVGRNKIPIVIPCHRVVATSSIGGYSAFQGVKSKKFLLTLESGEIVTSCVYKSHSV